jgi:hypothetical protein
LEFDLHVVVIAIICFGFSTKTIRDGSIIGFWGTRAGGRGKIIADVNHEEGRMMIAAGGRTDGGYGQNKSEW